MLKHLQVIDFVGEADRMMKVLLTVEFEQQRFTTLFIFYDNNNNLNLLCNENVSLEECFKCKI